MYRSHSKPNGTIVPKLDLPLEKANDADVVEVELFSMGVDDDGSTELECCVCPRSTHGPRTEHRRLSCPGAG